MACACGEKKRVYYDIKQIKFMEIEFKRIGKNTTYAGKSFNKDQTYKLDLAYDVALAIQSLPGYEVINIENGSKREQPPAVEKVEPKEEETEEIEIEIDENYCQYIIMGKDPHQCKFKSRKNKKFCKKHLKINN